MRRLGLLHNDTELLLARESCRIFNTTDLPPCLRDVGLHAEARWPPSRTSQWMRASAARRAWELQEIEQAW